MSEQDSLQLIAALCMRWISQDADAREIILDSADASAQAEMLGTSVARLDSLLHIARAAGK